MDKVTIILKIMNIVIQQRNPSLCFPRQTMISFLSEHYFPKIFTLCFIQQVLFFLALFHSDISWNWFLFQGLSIIYFFLLVHISLLYGYDIVYSHSGRNLGCFHLFIENKGAMDDSVQSFVWAYVFFILEKYLVI